MKLHKHNGIKPYGIAILLALFAVGCAKTPGKPNFGNKASVLGEDDLERIDPEDPEAFKKASQIAYKEHLYEPLIEKECTGCHHPNDTLEESHTYLLIESINGEGNDRIDFFAPHNSPTLQRVASNHNCGDTEICTEEFVAEAIEKWKAAIEAINVEVPRKVFPNTTDAVGFASSTLVARPFDGAEYLVMPANAATGTGTYATPGADDIDGAAEMYLGTPAGQDANNAGNATDVATFNVNATVAGDYFAWVRVKAPEDGQNSFFLTAGNQNGTDFIVDPGGEEWVWRQLVDEDMNPIMTTLPAGANTVSLAAQGGGARFNTLVLTTRPDPNLETFVTKYYDLEVDISEVSKVPGAKIVATVWEKAQGEDANKAVGVAELRIVSDTPLKVKGIKPLVNGVFNLNHATYISVDTTAGGADRAAQVISTGGSTASTWLADFVTDTVAFSFEEIGPAP